MKTSPAHSAIGMTAETLRRRSLSGMLLLIFLGLAGWSQAATKTGRATLVAQIPSSEDEALAAVEEVANDGIIHGTYSFEYERTLKGALPVASSPAFGDWKEKGSVFYKVVENVIAPRHFRETEAIGTISVRFVVTPVDKKNTNLRIDAVYVETAHRSVHPSDGAVEAAEYEAVKGHIDAFHARAKAVQETFEQGEQNQTAAGGEAAGPTASSPASLVQQLEARLSELRRQVQGRIKIPATPLRSAPFRTASTLEALPVGTDVVIVILTPYWYGVETAEGHRGWVHRSQLEPAR
jgi:hypothetical protein